jgi:hypothetical protein
MPIGAGSGEPGGRVDEVETARVRVPCVLVELDAVSVPAGLDAASPDADTVGSVGLRPTCPLQLEVEVEVEVPFDFAAAVGTFSACPFFAAGDGALWAEAGNAAESVVSSCSDDERKCAGRRSGSAMAGLLGV